MSLLLSATTAPSSLPHMVQTATTGTATDLKTKPPMPCQNLSKCSSVPLFTVGRNACGKPVLPRTEECGYRSIFDRHLRPFSFSTYGNTLQGSLPFSITPSDPQGKSPRQLQNLVRLGMYTLASTAPPTICPLNSSCGVPLQMTPISFLLKTL